MLSGPVVEVSSFCAWNQAIVFGQEIASIPKLVFFVFKRKITLQLAQSQMGALKFFWVTKFLYLLS